MSAMIDRSRAAAMPRPSAIARPSRVAPMVAAMRSCMWVTASRCSSGVVNGRASAIAAEQGMVLAVGDRSAGSYGLAQSRQRSGHHRQTRQRPLGQIDVEWIVGQWIERLDRFEPGGQNRALMKVELAYRLGAPFFRHSLCRETQGGAGIWHPHHT